MRKSEEAKSLPIIGKVKWYDSEKGYGFITTENEDKDVFLHVTVMKKMRLETLPDGQKVKFHMEPGKNGKGMQATSVEVL